MLEDNKMIGMKSILKSYYANSHVTHTSVGNPNGCYSVSREGFEQLFSAKADIMCLERPFWYSQFVVDIDMFVETDDLVQLHTKDDIQKLVKEIHAYLKTNLDGDINENVYDCIVLTKDPYMIEGGYCKHGFHLQFPYLFLGEEDRKRIHTHFSEKHENWDNIYNHYWLLYGCKKTTANAGRYKAKYVLNYNCTVQTNIITYIKEYKVYGIDEVPIKYNSVTKMNYLRRVLSISLYGRDHTYNFKKVANNTCARETIVYNKLDDDAEEEARIIIDEYIENNIDANCLEFVKINDKGYFVYKTTDIWSCPIGSEHTHSRIGCSFRVVNKSIKMYCFSKEKHCLEHGSIVIHQFGKDDEECTNLDSEVSVQLTEDTEESESDTEESIQLSVTEVMDIINEYVKCNMDSCVKFSNRNGKWFNFNGISAFKCPVNGKHHTSDCFFFTSISGIWYGCKTCRNNKNRKCATVRIHTIPMTKEQLKTYMDKKTRQNIEYLTNPGTYQEMDGKYVDTKIYNSSGCVVVRAGLGKGKTYSLVEHLNKTKYDRIIVLTPRITFAKSIHTRLNKDTNIDFAIYKSDTSTSYDIDDKFIVIQVESLHRLVKVESENTLIVCDEIESILTQMTSVTHGKNHRTNLDTFEFLMKNSNRIIALDAFISQRTLCLLSSMEISYKYYNYTVPMEDRDCRKCDDEDKLLISLCDDLNAGKKIYFFCSSNIKLTTMFLPAVLQNCKDVKIRQHTSKHKSSFTNVNEDWANVDLVCCTSTITVGVNFDTENVFDKVYMYVNGNSRNLVRDCFQSSYRVRHLNESELVYCIDPNHYAISLTTSRRKITHDITTRANLVAEQVSLPKVSTPKWIINLLEFNILENNVSIMNLEELFLKYLDMCSYTHLEEDNEYDLNDYLSESDITVKIPYDDIPVIDSTAVKAIKRCKIRGDTISDIDKASVEKFYFDCVCELRLQSDSVKENLWNRYIDHGKCKFNSLSLEKGLLHGYFSLDKLIDTTQYHELASVTSLKLELIVEICTALGLEYSQETKNISRTQMERAINYFSKNEERINTVFEIRSKKSSDKEFNMKSVQGMVNTVFGKWGYTKIKQGKRKRAQINNKRVDISEYENTPFEDEELWRFINSKRIS